MNEKQFDDESPYPADTVAELLAILSRLPANAKVSYYMANPSTDIAIEYDDEERTVFICSR